MKLSFITKKCWEWLGLLMRWIGYHLNPTVFFPAQLLLICLLFASIFGIVYLVIEWLSPVHSPSLDQLYPALAIFIPLVGGVLTYIWQRHSTTSRKRYGTLVELEEVLGHVYDGVRLISNKLKQFYNQDLALFTNFPTLEVPRSAIHYLGRISIKNEAISILIGLQRLMGDVSVLRAGAEELRRRHGGNYGELVNDHDHGALLQQYPRIIEYCESFLSEIEECMLNVRFFIRNDRPASVHLPFYSVRKLSDWMLKDRKLFREESREQSTAYLPEKKFCSGNAHEDSSSFDMWMVGDIERWCMERGKQFNSEECGLRADREVEIKWGVHEVDDPQAGKRGEWSRGGYHKSISLLLHGRFQVIFLNEKDGSEEVVNLQNEGDYVMWHSIVPHKWIALEKSTIITIRW